MMHMMRKPVFQIPTIQYDSCHIQNSKYSKTFYIPDNSKLGAFYVSYNLLFWGSTVFLMYVQIILGLVKVAKWQPFRK